MGFTRPNKEGVIVSLIKTIRLIYMASKSENKTKYVVTNKLYIMWLVKMYARVMGYKLDVGINWSILEVVKRKEVKS